MKYDLLVKKMITNGHKHSDFSESMQRCHDYIKALEDERRKIQVFQRELPLCLELVTQAIETCKQQLSGTTTQAECNLRGQSECSEQTTSDVPVLEEFIPMKRASSDSDGEEQDSKKPKNEMSDCDNEGKNSSEKNCKKSDWLRSVQLWNNQSPDPTYKEVQDSSRKSTASKAKRNGRGGAFIPFKKERGVASDGHASQAVAMPASTSSTAENGSGSKKESQRKARRCWSPELHRRFLQALQQLGGSHVATPKQIREFMKVDGLTNDEVKSHLQKYRLHTRRPSPSTNNNAQTPQFVVVGGLWVPHASMATNTTPTDAAGGAPIAAPPPTFQEPPPSPKQKQHIKPSLQSNYSKGSAHSCSPATSSSSVHTTTAVSPAC